MRGIKLLIVENNTSLVDMMKAVSSGEPGLEVIGVAGSASAALRMLREAVPDVIVTDIHLPDMSGLDVTSRMLEKAPQVKVILLTDEGDLRYQGAATRNGASACLRKDLIATDLVATVKRLGSEEKSL
jgi:DNA-binding NarL/FixJ family response regulator